MWRRDGKRGIYKSEVMRARSKLLAQGLYPSIDAVRAELGAGSKSTIHRYLKEIEEGENTSGGKKVSVSSAILDLAGTLAAQLHDEADARVIEASEQHQRILSQKEAELSAALQQINSLKQLLENSQAELAEEQSNHKNTINALKNETLERVRLQQQAIDLQARLAEEANLRRSLEQKHQHAYEALEHFRQAAKEQRDQENRQHEQQVQYLQSELKALNHNLS